ncbi:MAG: V-type ATP synthase subunit K [Spirochaetes bacterium]|nr:V-type ATP synthase subunit K [Spirochaetota bacterium]
MEVGLLGWLGVAGALGWAAIGSSIGMVMNGSAVIGAWKKCFVQKKPAPFILVVFAGVQLSNVIYGFILMGALGDATGLSEGALFALGTGAGLAIGAASYAQCYCAAAAADAYAETGQGFGNFMMVIGIAETLALFAMVFTLLLV